MARIDTHDQSVWYSCPETAGLLRAALKAAFPGQRFSVRSESYAGGASISVRWVDGPAMEAVEAVAGAFRGASFDGSTDSMHYHTSTHDGRTVRWGADFVSCYRETHEEHDRLARLELEYRQRRQQARASRRQHPWGR